MNIEIKLEDEDGAFVRPPPGSRQSVTVLELPLGEQH